MHNLLIIAIANHGEPIYEFFKQIKEIQNRLHDNVEFYFMYADPDMEEDFKVDGSDVFVKVEPGVTKGCSIKTLKTLEWIEKEKEYDYVVRTNLSSIFNIERLIEGVNTISTDKPICSGLVFNGCAFGTFIVWNRLAVRSLVQPSSYEWLKRTGYMFNDDVALSRLCHVYNIQFDMSLTNKVKETQYSFFCSPEIGNDWILAKRPRNEFTTRYFSDMWSINQKNMLSDEVREQLIVPDYDKSEFAHSILLALRYMDMTQNTKYMIPNTHIMMGHIDELKDGHCELIYYILKYLMVGLSKNVVKRIINSTHYKPNKKYMDVIFYYGQVKRKLDKETYNDLKMKTGTWRDL